MIIDGEKIAQRIEKKIKGKLKKLKMTPRLAVILIGRNPASEIYVQRKEEACKRLNIKYQTFRLSGNIDQNKLLSLIEKLNKDKKINGILIQLPLPVRFNKTNIFYSIAPWKDIDGLNPLNLGFLETGQPFIVSPTASCILEIMKYLKIKTQGKYACLVGYSELVGKPLLPLLIDKGLTVTICHKRTKKLANFTQKADILIVAAGSPNLIKSSMVKKGATVIDAGINIKGKEIIGDVDFKNVKNKAAFITPVPKGVGPVTVSMLLSNLIELSY